LAQALALSSDGDGLNKAVIPANPGRSPGLQATAPRLKRSSRRTPGSTRSTVACVDPGVRPLLSREKCVLVLHMVVAPHEFRMQMEGNSIFFCGAPTKVRSG
jgi:hypothetical protein